MKIKKKLKNLNYNLLKKIGIFMFFFFTLFSFSENIYAQVGGTESIATTTGQNGDLDWTLNFVVPDCVTSSSVLYSFYEDETTGSGRSSNSGCSGTNFHVNELNLYIIIGDHSSTTGRYFVYFCSPTGSCTNSNVTGADHWASVYWDGFIATTDPFYENSTTTRITEIVNPLPNTTEEDETVDFNFNYFARGDDGYDYVGRELRDITEAYEYLPVENLINATGYSNFSEETLVQENHFHLWRAYIRNSTSGERINGQWISFEVAGFSAPISEICLGSECTATSTGFMGFLNIPNLLRTKAPFAYLPAMWDMLTDSGSIATTTATSSTMSFTLASGTPWKQNISFDMFSQTTFNRFLPSWIISFLRNIMVFSLGAGLLWFIYHDLKTRKVI